MEPLNSICRCRLLLYGGVCYTAAGNKIEKITKLNPVRILLEIFENCGLETIFLALGWIHFWILFPPYALHLGAGIGPKSVKNASKTQFCYSPYGLQSGAGMTDHRRPKAAAQPAQPEPWLRMASFCDCGSGPVPKGNFVTSVQMLLLGHYVMPPLIILLHIYIYI